MEAWLALPRNSDDPLTRSDPTPTTFLRQRTMSKATAILQPPVLAQQLKSAARHALQDDGGTSNSRSSNADADAAATRIALETCEKTAALLRAQLLTSDTDNDGSPPVKRRAVERECEDVAAASSAGGSRRGGGRRASRGIRAQLLRCHPLVRADLCSHGWSCVV